MSCRSYGRLSIASLWKRSHQKSPLDGKPSHVLIHCYEMTGECIDLSLGFERRIRDDCCWERFVLRFRKEDSCWLLPKTTEYFVYQRGVLRWKIWTFTQLSCVAFLCLVGVTEDCRSRLYGNVLIKKYPPTTKDLELGGILDQDVIHYDTWIRKHSFYAFTRLSARGLSRGYFLMRKVP